MFTHSRKYRIALAAVAVAATVAAISGCSSSTPGTTPTGGGSGGTLQPINIVAGVAASESTTPMFIGIQNGYFAAEGINITTQPIATSAAGVSEMINGQIQIAFGGLTSTIQAVSQGLPIAFLSGGPYDSPDGGGWYQTLVSPTSGIKSFKDLAGKTVAENSLGCCWEYWTRESVTLDGGDQTKLHLVQLPFAQQVAALEAGQVDAIVTQQPFATQALQAGYVNLGDPPAIAYNDPYNGAAAYFASKTFLDAHPDFVSRWDAALQKASDYANANPDQVRSAFVTSSGDDAALINAAPVPHYSAALDTDSIQKEAALMVKYGAIKTAPELSSMIAAGATTATPGPPSAAPTP